MNIELGTKAIDAIRSAREGFELIARESPCICAIADCMKCIAEEWLLHHGDLVKEDE